MIQAEADLSEEHEPSLAVQRVIIALCLLLLATVSCAWLYQHAAQIRSVAPAGPPSFWSYVTGNGLMWFLTMTAMMLPSITPTLFLYSRFALAQGSAIQSSLVMLMAYLGVWAGFSLITAIAQFLLVRFGVPSELHSAIGDRRMMGILLVLAGLYQFSKLKSVCLDGCRSPLSFVVRLWRPGWRGAFNIGLRHGLHCLGCYWLVMSLLFISGLMNVTWLVGLAMLVLIEKAAPYGHRIAQAAGVIALVWGVTLLVSSALIA